MDFAHMIEHIRGKEHWRRCSQDLDDDWLAKSVPSESSQRSGDDEKSFSVSKRPRTGRGRCSEPKRSKTDEEFFSDWAKSILRNQGYQDGRGLGALGQGITNMNEVLPKGRTSRRGIGAESGGRIRRGRNSQSWGRAIRFQKEEDLEVQNTESMDGLRPRVEILEFAQAKRHLEKVRVPTRVWSRGPCTNFKGLEYMSGDAHVGIFKGEWHYAADPLSSTDGDWCVRLENRTKKQWWVQLYGEPQAEVNPDLPITPKTKKKASEK